MSAFTMGLTFRGGADGAQGGLGFLEQANVNGKVFVFQVTAFILRQGQQINPVA